MTTDRAWLCEQPVTLNGERAKVTGIKRDFALVTQIGTGLACEWSWHTVEHVIRNKGGRFQS